MKRADPTTTTGWEGAEDVPDWVVEESRQAGARGIEPFEITPGAPPVREEGRAPKQARRRTLLRAATIQRRLLRKANATPNLAPPRKVVGEGRHARVERKPDTVPTDFFKPANPLITNVVGDRPPEPRKADDPTLDPAPERAVAPPPPAPEPELPAPLADDLGDDWFDLDGTVEPAEARDGDSPVRMMAIGFGIGAVVMTALAVIAVSLLGGGPVPEVPEPAVEPGWEPIMTTGPVSAPVEPIAEPAAGEPTAEPVAAEPVLEEAVAEPVVAEPDVVPDLPETTALDRLRAGVAKNPVFEEASEAAPEPAAVEPVEIPEGSAELWADVAPQTPEPQNIWGSLKNQE